MNIWESDEDTKSPKHVAIISDLASSSNCPIHYLYRKATQYTTYVEVRVYIGHKTSVYKRLGHV